MICYKWLKATLRDWTPLPSTPGSVCRHTWSWEVHVMSICFWVKEHEATPWIDIQVVLLEYWGPTCSQDHEDQSSWIVFPGAPTDSGGGELWPCPRHQFSSRVPGTTQLSGAWPSPEQLSLCDSSLNLSPLWHSYYHTEAWGRGADPKRTDFGFRPYQSPSFI